MGIVPFDLLYTVERYPEVEMKIDATGLAMQGGGPVPNAMIGLARMGFKTALIAAVGSDPIGKLGIDELKKDKVDCRYMIVKKQPSAVATGWVEQGSGRRTMVLGREIFVKPSDLTLSKYLVPRLLHLDGRDMEATMKLARWGKRNGAIVSFDIGSMRNDVSAVFKYVDHLVVADSYAFPFTKTRTARAAVEKLRSWCPGSIVVTEGIKGSTGLEAGRYDYCAAYRVKAVDTTGAGDAFHVGYLYGLLKGLPMAERLKLGAATAALKCLRPGARTGLPTVRQLRAFLKSKPAKYRGNKK
jgi:sugar/nucleoside kinase (ribokinase family)